MQCRGYRRVPSSQCSASNRAALRQGHTRRCPAVDSCPSSLSQLPSVVPVTAMTCPHSCQHQIRPGNGPKLFERELRPQCCSTMPIPHQRGVNVAPLLFFPDPGPSMAPDGGSDHAPSCSPHTSSLPHTPGYLWNCWTERDEARRGSQQAAAPQQAYMGLQPHQPPMQDLE